MALSERELLRRADVELAQFQSVGTLSYDQADRFLDMVVEQPTILNQARFIRMTAPKMQIAKIGFTSRIMRQARQPMGARDDGTNTRHLPAAERAVPTQQSMELDTVELMAEVHIPYEVLEDNIEGESMEGHLIRLMAERTAQDLEELGLQGDTALADPYLNLKDGYLKRANLNVVDVVTSGVSPEMFASGMLAMPQRFLRNYGRLKHFVTIQDTIRYRSRVSQRQTGYGDSLLTNDGGLQVHGIQVEGAPLMPANNGLFTYPQNLIFGVWRNISIETDRDIRARTIIIVLTIRAEFNIEEEQAVVQYININP